MPLASPSFSSCLGGTGVPSAPLSRCAQSRRPLSTAAVLGAILAPLPRGWGRQGLPSTPAPPRSTHRHPLPAQGCSSLLPLHGRLFLAKPPHKAPPVGALPLAWLSLGDGAVLGGSGAGHGWGCGGVSPGTQQRLELLPTAPSPASPAAGDPQSLSAPPQRPPPALPRHPPRAWTSSCLRCPVQYFLMSPGRCRACNSSAPLGMWCSAGVRAEGPALAEPSVCAQPLRA